MYGYAANFWDVTELDERDRSAVEAMDGHSPGLPSDPNHPQLRDGLLAAFRALLHSPDVRARGVALDQYCYADGQIRWGKDNPLAAVDDEVLEQARAFLAVTPDPGAPLSAQPTVTAGWASAVDALWRVAGSSADDVVQLTAVLDAVVADFHAAPGEDHVSADILSYEFFGAFQKCLRDADDATCRRAGVRLAALITDDALPVTVRTEAMAPFRDVRDYNIAAKLGHEDVLVRMLGDDLKLSLASALTLIRHDAHVPLVRQAAAGWPADAPWPAEEIKRMLEEIDHLALARSVIGTAAGRDLREAVDAVSRHGDSSDLDALLAVLDRTDLASAGGFGTELLSAVRRRLDGADTTAHRRAGSRLAAVFTDERLPTAVREAAIRPFWDEKHHAALDQTDAVIAMLHHDDIELSAAAAYGLLAFEEHLPLVRGIAATWPDDAPERAQYVREDLDEVC